MKLIRTFAFMLFTSMVVASLLFSGCKKEEEEVAPQLPPTSAFVMNFEDFSDAGDTLKSGAVVDGYSNWGYSFGTVAIWNVFLTVGLAVPVASYVEAFNHTPVYHPDEGNWTWSYNFVAAGATWEAELTGTLESTMVDWQMRISNSAGLSDFLWYRGKSSIDQSGGYWILAENPENPNDLLRIDWKNYEDGTADIKYANIKTGDPENGSYIWYGTSLTSFDRFYKIYRKPVNNYTSIEWSSTLHNGRVKDPLHFLDTDWHCWDANLLDVTCP